MEDLMKDFPKGEKYAALTKSASELINKAKTWDENMVQRKSKAYDDVDNYENKFTANFMFLINHSESDIPKVTNPNRERLVELKNEWIKLNLTAVEILEKDGPSLSKQLWEAGIGALRMPLK